MEVSLIYKKYWQIKSIKPISLNKLTSVEEQEHFANTFEKFSNKIWRKPKARKSYRYDLAILVDPNEAMPPSDSKALKRFVRAANQLGISADLIEKKDYMDIKVISF